MNIEKTSSETIKIYIAGSRHSIEDGCKEFCNAVGFCVTVTETNYIYTGGCESGFEIGIINYARFPSEYNELMKKAQALAKKLMNAAFQSSCSVVSSKESIYMYNHLRPQK